MQIKPKRMKTSAFQWKEEFSVGLEKVDNQHKEFLRIINELGDSIANRTYYEKRTEIFVSLVDFAHRHLLGEKILANSVEDLDYSYYRQKHKEFSTKLISFQESCQKDCSEQLFIDLYNYLKKTYPEYISHYTPSLIKILRENDID